MFLQRMRRIIIIVGLGLLTPSLALAGGLKSDSKVKVTPAATKPDAAGKQTITFQLEIAEGWYIYANPVNNPAWETTRTQVFVKGGTITPEDVKTTYPVGVPHEMVTIYENKVLLQTVVNRGSSTEPLDVVIRVYACNKSDRNCLPKGEVKLRLP